MNSFAFVREPVSRALSMFRFLQPEIRSYAISLRISKCSASDLFDLFLKMLSLQRESSAYSKPFGLRFSTHVNPAWSDIVDNDENILLANLFRLDDLERGLGKVYAECGLVLPRQFSDFANKTPRSGAIGAFVPSVAQKEQLLDYYKRDLFLYQEKCFHFPV